MSREVVRYLFRDDISRDEVEATLVLSVMAVTALVGESAVQIDARCAMDPDRCMCVIDAGTETGRSIARVFAGLSTKEFGTEAFVVERVVVPVSPPAA